MRKPCSLILAFLCLCATQTFAQKLNPKIAKQHQLNHIVILPAKVSIVKVGIKGAEPMEKETTAAKPLFEKAVANVLQEKKFAEALSNLEKSYSLEPEIPLTLLLLGYANLSLDRYEEARQSLQQAIKIGGESTARAHVYLAEVYAHEKKFKEASEEIQMYLKMKPNSPDAASLKKMEEGWKSSASKK